MAASSEPWVTFRDAITAFIAVALIATFVVVGYNLWFYDNGDVKSQAWLDSYARRKDIFTVMFGIVGAVIGYYFGKNPAENQAQAAKSAQKSAEAEAQDAKTAQKSAETREHNLKQAVRLKLDDLLVPVEGRTALAEPHHGQLRDLMRMVE